MAHRIEARTHGGPEVLEWREFEPSPPAVGEVLVRHSAVGLNYIDVYHRSGAYPAELPLVPGLEAAGVVEALGPRVEGLAVGDRIAYAAPPLGAYAEVRTMPADKVVRLPDSISNEVAAALASGRCAAPLKRLIVRTSP